MLLCQAGAEGAGLGTQDTFRTSAGSAPGAGAGAGRASGTGGSGTGGRLSSPELSCRGVPFVAKVADFGLSKTFTEAATHMSTATVGTVGVWKGGRTWF